MPHPCDDVNLRSKNEDFVKISTTKNEHRILFSKKYDK